MLGLTWKRVDLNAGTIKIAQRVWHQEISRPKSEDSRRLLGIGVLPERLFAKAAEGSPGPDDFVFQQRRAAGRPLWDSGVPMHSTRPQKRRAVISLVWDRIRSGAPRSHGCNKSAAARSNLSTAPHAVV